MRLARPRSHRAGPHLAPSDYPVIALAPPLGYVSAVTCRRFLPLLAVLALLLAPFGRAAAAEAMAASGHTPAGSASHCRQMPSENPVHDGQDHRGTIDCLIACAVVAAEDSPSLAARPAAASAKMARALPTFTGLHPESDPPPPRFS